MGQEQPSAFYDTHLQPFLTPYETSPWRDVYDAVAELLPEDRNISILDVGCGTGRCGYALAAAGYRNYLGIDFSARRLEEARRYVPSVRFMQVDALSDEARLIFRDYDVFILCEVLEHLAEDRKLLSLIPASRLVILSVPNFDAAAHVRTFASVESVAQRFAELLRFDLGATKTLARRRPGDKIFVLRAVRLG